eukprot:TRINITY_DN42039_c0_g1_i1.p1 TRINITY_DN42039_c0_g1~~TRINITY_DN42039_c0_g1_i1.p1  ORF type:complete len:1326 (-),score=195.52 TRINITY_DN42039_c0_g1_i1:190-4128(-)
MASTPRIGRPAPPESLGIVAASQRCVEDGCSVAAFEASSAQQESSGPPLPGIVGSCGQDVEVTQRAWLPVKRSRLGRVLRRFRRAERRLGDSMTLQPAWQEPDAPELPCLDDLSSSAVSSLLRPPASPAVSAAPGARRTLDCPSALQALPGQRPEDGFTSASERQDAGGLALQTGAGFVAAEGPGNARVPPGGLEPACQSPAGSMLRGLADSMDCGRGAAACDGPENWQAEILEALSVCSPKAWEPSARERWCSEDRLLVARKAIGACTARRRTSGALKLVLRAGLQRRKACARLLCRSFAAWSQGRSRVVRCRRGASAAQRSWPSSVKTATPPEKHPSASTIGMPLAKMFYAWHFSAAFERCKASPPPAAVGVDKPAVPAASKEACQPLPAMVPPRRAAADMALLRASAHVDSSPCNCGPRILPMFEDLFARMRQSRLLRQSVSAWQLFCKMDSLQSSRQKSHQRGNLQAAPDKGHLRQRPPRGAGQPCKAGTLQMVLLLAAWHARAKRKQQQVQEALVAAEAAHRQLLLGKVIHAWTRRCGRITAVAACFAPVVARTQRIRSPRSTRTSRPARRSRNSYVERTVFEKSDGKPLGHAQQSKQSHAVIVERANQNWRRATRSDIKSAGGKTEVSVADCVMEQEDTTATKKVELGIRMASSFPTPSETTGLDHASYGQGLDEEEAELLAALCAPPPPWVRHTPVEELDCATVAEMPENPPSAGTAMQAAEAQALHHPSIRLHGQVGSCEFARQADSCIEEGLHLFGFEDRPGSPLPRRRGTAGPHPFVPPLKLHAKRALRTESLRPAPQRTDPAGDEDRHSAHAAEDRSLPGEEPGISHTHAGATLAARMPRKTPAWSGCGSTLRAGLRRQGVCKRGGDASPERTVLAPDFNSDSRPEEVTPPDRPRRLATCSARDVLGQITRVAASCPDVRNHVTLSRTDYGKEGVIPDRQSMPSDSMSYEHAASTSSLSPESSRWGAQKHLLTLEAVLVVGRCFSISKAYFTAWSSMMGSDGDESAAAGNLTKLLPTDASAGSSAEAQAGSFSDSGTQMHAESFSSLSSSSELSCWDAPDDDADQASSACRTPRTMPEQVWTGSGSTWKDLSTCASRSGQQLGGEDCLHEAGLDGVRVDSQTLAPKKLFGTPEPTPTDGISHISSPSCCEEPTAACGAHRVRRRSFDSLGLSSDSEASSLSVAYETRLLAEALPVSVAEVRLPQSVEQATAPPESVSEQGAQETPIGLTASSGPPSSCREQLGPPPRPDPSFRSALDGGERGSLPALLNCRLFGRKLRPRLPPPPLFASRLPAPPSLVRVA